MKYMLTLMLALGCLLPASARPEGKNSPSREDWLNAGKSALSTLVGSVAPEAESAANPADSAAKASPAVAAVALPGVGQAMLPAIRATVDELIDEYKERYKEEGRAYAREVGNIVVARVVHDPEINATITSLRTLCWCVVGYLTVVTFIMLGCLARITRLVRGAQTPRR